MGIGTLGEKTLHQSLKYYIEPCEEYHEVSVGKYVADIMRDGKIVEVQTRSFDKLREKLKFFLTDYEVTVVFPIPKTKWYYITDSESGKISQKKKSPRHGSVYDLFKELYKIKMLLGNERLSFRVLLLDITEYRCTTEKSYKNKKGIKLLDRVPNSIEEDIFISSVEDFKNLIPENLPSPFTLKEFAKEIRRSRREATKAINILRYVGAISFAGKRGREYLYKK